jgi:hypothetical protein
MKRGLPLVVAVWACASFLEAQAIAPGEIRGEIGSNYFGQTLGFSYSHRILDPFWGSLGMELGRFNLSLDPGESFLGFANNTSYEYQVGLSIRWMATASLALRFEEKGEFRFLNSLGTGVSFYDAAFHLSRRSPSSSLFQGSQDHSGFALHLHLSLVEYHPPKDRLFFGLGVKGSTAFLSSPQSMVIRNSSGATQTLTLSTKDGSPIPFPYFEAFLGIGYGID